ncbi:hypothetical protein [Pseudomonas aeruginosa]|uniref:hypothetical protein n=1 Tax=Pseudomonas aeruginosa TaxID=287 RepID=UPI001EEC4AB8|nr:hypothetical protein [Pseudomonas aeruginosa]
MQFVIDDVGFIFSEEANFDNIERLEVLLDLLDDIWSDGWVAYYSEELFYKEVGWGPMSSTLEIIHKYHIISAQISAWEKPF